MSPANLIPVFLLVLLLVDNFPAAMGQLLHEANSTIVAPGLHEIGSLDKESFKGRVIYGSISVVGLAVLIGCFVKRSIHLTFNSLRNMNVLSALVLLVYALGAAFIVAGIILQLGLGLTTLTRCKIAIELCLTFYVGGKVLLYFFLVERVHTIRAGRLVRYKDWVWMGSFLCVAGGFSTIAVFAFLSPIAKISATDHRCRIGLPSKVTLPLLVYDVVMNVGMSGVFAVLLHPHSSEGMLKRTILRWCGRQVANNNVIDRDDMWSNLILKSLVASLVILAGTVANFAVLFMLRGRELGWLCFTMCTVDSKNPARTPSH
ncbi:MAG: hypothetical protein M1826_004095 [Phylliscum demangeonii]|nr:MAG: hypothetical protein M1826_004095 [Phylliscum demangeonii]